MVEEALVDLMADLEQRLPVCLGKQASDAEVAGVVDGRLGPERAALFEVLLDLGGAVVHLDRGLDAVVEDLGVKPPGVRRVDTPAEDDRGLVGAAERELVGQRRSNQARPAAGRSKPWCRRSRAWRNESACPYPRSAVLVGQGRGQRGLPAPEEQAHVLSRQAVADPGERLRVIAEANPLSSAWKAMPCRAACCLAHSFPLR